MSEATGALVSGLALSTPVEYRDTDGRRKAAIVVATPYTMGACDAKTGLSGPAEGCAHLMVLSFTGSVYVKHNVPAGEGPLTFTVL